MIAVTQCCLDATFQPLGIVMAESCFADNREKRLSDLITNLSKQAPEGTTHLFNLHFEERDYHGNMYYFGYADAYRK